MIQNGTCTEEEFDEQTDQDGEVTYIGGTEPTPEPELSDTDKAHKLRTTIEMGFKNYQAGSHYAYGAIGKALTEMREGKAYKFLGYKTMDEVIKDMGKSRSICYSMMDYADVITPVLGTYPTLTNIDVTTLCKYVIPYLRNIGKSGGTDDVKTGLELIESIAAQGEAEQADEIRRLRGKKVQVDCAHEKTEAWVRCCACSKFIKVT